MQMFLTGVAACGSCGIAVFFLRFWADTGDRFFLLFAGAFAVLSANWLLLAALQPAGEARPFFYVLRLIAFVLILGAVWEKNRSPSA